jgi:hypothetical protein
MVSRNLIALFSLVIVFSAFLPGRLASQEQASIELGLDAGVAINISDDSFEFAQLSIPCQRFRVGLFLLYGMEFEPTLSVTHVFRDGVDITNATFALSLIQNYGNVLNSSSTFIQFGPSINWFRTRKSDLQIGIGAGAGVRVPAGDRLNVRVQFLINRFFESDRFNPYWDLSTIVGLSFIAG